MTAPPQVIAPLSDAAPSTTAAGATPDDPHWLGDWKPYQDAVLYAKTLRHIVFHPHRFGGAWVRGELVAFNPAAFFLISTALSAATSSLWRHLRRGFATRILWAGTAMLLYGLVPLLP